MEPKELTSSALRRTMAKAVGGTGTSPRIPTAKLCVPICIPAQGVRGLTRTRVGIVISSRLMNRSKRLETSSVLHEKATPNCLGHFFFLGGVWLVKMMFCLGRTLLAGFCWRFWRFVGVFFLDREVPARSFGDNNDVLSGTDFLGRSSAGVFGVFLAFLAFFPWIGKLGSTGKY